MSYLLFVGAVALAIYAVVELLTLIDDLVERWRSDVSSE